MEDENGNKITKRDLARNYAGPRESLRIEYDPMPINPTTFFMKYLPPVCEQFMGIVLNILFKLISESHRESLKAELLV